MRCGYITVHVRHVVIEKYQVNWVRDELLKGFRTIARGQDVVSLQLQQHFPAFENLQAVIRTEDQRFAIHGSPPIFFGLSAEPAISRAEYVLSVARFDLVRMLPVVKASVARDGEHRGFRLGR